MCCFGDVAGVRMPFKFTRLGRLIFAPLPFVSSADDALLLFILLLFGMPAALAAAAATAVVADTRMLPVPFAMLVVMNKFLAAFEPTTPSTPSKQSAFVNFTNLFGLCVDNSAWLFCGGLDTASELTAIKLAAVSGVCCCCCCVDATTAAALSVI